MPHRLQIHRLLLALQHCSNIREMTNQFAILSLISHLISALPVLIQAVDNSTSRNALKKDITYLQKQI